jgi:carbon monoxide dehydrogenase subunit G
MQFAGSVTINAPRDRVYAFLIDPRRVGPCGPGFESVVVRDPTHFRGVAKVGVRFISMRFNVDVEVVEAVENEMAVLRGTGQAPGSSVEGTARMRLSDAPAGGTRMDWQADVAIHGRIAGVGARLLQGTAEKLIARTFACIGSTLESATPAA